MNDNHAGRVEILTVLLSFANVGFKKKQSRDIRNGQWAYYEINFLRVSSKEYLY